MRKLIPCLLVAGLVAVGGCKKDGTSGGPGVVAKDDPLTYVPSDTPYVFANIDPVPADVTNAWFARIDGGGKLGDIYAGQLDALATMIRDKAPSCGATPPVAGGGSGSAMQDPPAGSDTPDDTTASSDASTDSTDASATEAPSSDTSTPAAVAGTDGSENAMSATDGDPCSPDRVARREKALKMFAAVKAEVAGKDTKGLLDVIGLAPQNMHVAFYGIGLVPVVRLELAKPENFKALVGRIETAAGSKLDTGKVGTLDYWSYDGGGNEPSPVRLVFALSGKHLVATVAPANADEASLKTLFGVDKPAKSLADSGDLAALDKKMNYLSYGSGYFDSAKLVAVLKAPATPLETAFLKAMKTTKPAIDPVCASEYDVLAAAWPRASAGYTEVTPNHMALRGVVETRADIAKDLMTLRSAMPGMKAAETSLFDLGFSLDLSKLPALATKYADQTAKSPWKCPQLAHFNEGAEKFRTSMSNPQFAGSAPMFHGLHVIFDKLVITEGQPMPDMAAVVAIGSDNPAQLLGMAGNMLPSLASAGIAPDGKAKPIPPLPNMPINAPLFGAMTDKALGISIGTGEEARLTDAMAYDPAQMPVFAGSAKGEVYHLIAQFQRKSGAMMTDPAMKASIEQQASLSDMYAKWFKRMVVSVDLTEQGIEVKEAVDMQ